jgi:hypothetical protein
MSAAEIIESLQISDSWFTSKFDRAVKDLAGKGLIKEVS